MLPEQLPTLGEGQTHESAVASNYKQKHYSGQPSIPHRSKLYAPLPSFAVNSPMATEKGLERSVVYTDTSRNGDVASIATETSGLRRELSSRHINMIAIAGMIVRRSRAVMLC